MLLYAAVSLYCKFSIYPHKHLYVASSYSAGNLRTLNFKQWKAKEKIHIHFKNRFFCLGQSKYTYKYTRFSFLPNNCLLDVWTWHMHNQGAINQTKTFWESSMKNICPQKAINFYSQSFVYNMIYLRKKLRHISEIFN